MKTKLTGIILALLLALALAIIAWLGYINQEKKEAFAAMEAEIAELTAQVEAVSAENAELTAENEALTAEIASAGDVNAALEAEVAALNEAAAADAAEIAALQEETAALEEEIVAYEEQLAGAAASDRTDELNASVLQLTEELNAANSRIEELEGLLPALTTPAEAAQTRVTVPDEIAVTGGVNAEIGFLNGNESFCSVYVSLLVDGETVYESGELVPGTELGQATLEKALPSGEHEGYLVWKAYNEKGELISSAMAAVTVIAE